MFTRIRIMLLSLLFWGSFALFVLSPVWAPFAALAYVIFAKGK